MVLKLLREQKPDYAVFCFDRPEASFRKEISPAYKATRSETPEDLKPQIPYMRKVGELLGIACIDVPGFEADDIIGTLTKIGRQQDLDVVIVSGDKDFAQLVDGHVCMYDTMKETRYKSDQVKEKWGVLPNQIVDYLAIVGDTSDNIAGVKGIGPKGAQKLLEEFGTLENIYASLESIKGATHDKLLASKEDALLAQRLVKIHCDIEIDPNLTHYQLRPVDQESVESLFDELNFKALRNQLRQLPNWAGGTATTTPASSVESPAVDVGSEQNFKIAVSELPHFNEPHEIQPEDLAKHFRMDRELWLAHLPSGLYVADEGTGRTAKLAGSPEAWSDRFSESKISFQGYDLKSIWHEMRFHLLPMQTSRAGWDAMIASYLLRPGEPVGLDHIVGAWLHTSVPDLLSPVDYFRTQVALKRTLSPEIDKKAKDIFYQIELPLIEVLFAMERRGVRLDVAMLKEQSQRMQKQLLTVEADVHQQAGQTFNIASPKQLGHILFEVLKLPHGKKTKTGFSTDVDVLEKLRKQHPIADLVLQYRELTKLKSTYIDVLPSLVAEDGRVHTTFNQALTATGRLSSQNPNLQNIPIRTELGAEVRRAFVAEEGCELLSADYSQIELRLLAHFSEDPNLKRAFEQNLDVHALTASEVFNVELGSVSSEQRRTAKAINFGIAYGQGAFGLSEGLNISRSDAQKIIDRYFERFKGVREYMNATIVAAKERGYVETMLGRRRYVDELRSANPNMRRFGERIAINAPIQGSAADIVKKAMIEVYRTVKSPMILQVHDELVFEGAPNNLESDRAEIVKLMESTVRLSVPLSVNAAIGSSWQEAH